MLESHLVIRDEEPRPSQKGFRFFVHRVCNMFEKSVKADNQQNDCVKCPLGEFSLLFAQ